RIFLRAVMSDLRKLWNIIDRFAQVWEAIDVHDGDIEIRNAVGRGRIVDHQGDVESWRRVRVEFVLRTQEILLQRNHVFVAMKYYVSAWQLLQDEAKLAYAAPADVTSHREQRKSWLRGHELTLWLCRIDENVELKPRSSRKTAALDCRTSRFP